MRRKPVPARWRDRYHRLRVRSHVAGRNIFGNSWRAKGVCLCGAKWPEGSHTDNMTRADVIDAWKDHVEDVYYHGGQADA